MARLAVAGDGWRAGERLTFEHVQVATERVARAPAHVEQCRHPRGEEAEVEGFRHVVVRAPAKRLTDHGAAALGGHHHHREVERRARAPHLVEHVEAADPGEHEVQQDEVGALLSKRLQRRLSVVRDEDLVAELSEVHREQLTEERLVVDDEDLRSAVGHREERGGGGW